MFCSRRCSKLKDLPTKTCEKCGSEFRKNTEYSYAVWEKIRYCSIKCRGNGKTKTILTCATCGIAYTKSQYWYESKSTYCSQTCYWLSLRSDRYPVNKGRFGREFSKPSKRIIMARANGKCQTCGATENLQYDHLVPCHQGGGNDEANGQILCRPCHVRKTADELAALFAH